MSQPTINASHLTTQIASEVRRSEEAAILARAAARERPAEPPAPATPPVAATPAPAKSQPPKPVRRAPAAAKPPKAAPPPKPKRKIVPKTKTVRAQPGSVAARAAVARADLPAGWVLLDPGSSKAVRNLIRTHPQTRDL